MFDAKICYHLCVPKEAFFRNKEMHVLGLLTVTQPDFSACIVNHIVLAQPIACSCTYQAHDVLGHWFTCVSMSSFTEHISGVRTARCERRALWSAAHLACQDRGKLEVLPLQRLYEIGLTFSRAFGHFERWWSI